MPRKGQQLTLLRNTDPSRPPAEVVSVIIPAYNAAAYIKETLDSVFAQTYPFYEIVVVNDGSPDTVALEAVLEPYRDRIVYVTQENRGLAGARNTGLRTATGSLVALLDADDLWFPNYLEEQAGYLQEHPDVDLVYCDAEFFGENIPQGTYYMTVCPSEGEPDVAGIISKRCNVFVSVTARTQPLREVGFDESLRACEDYDCWMRFTAAGHRIGYQRKLLARYRRHPGSLSANYERMAEISIGVLSKMLPVFPAGSPEAAAVLEARAKRTAELDVIRGKLALDNGDMTAALTHFRSANQYYRSLKHHFIVSCLEVIPSWILFLYRTRARLSRRYR